MGGAAIYDGVLVTTGNAYITWIDNVSAFVSLQSKDKALEGKVCTSSDGCVCVAYLSTACSVTLLLSA